MPPKNKKQAEQQARRLQEEQRKKEEEQRLQAQQKRKYANQTLKTGLILPISSRLIRGFTNSSLQFLYQKMTPNLIQLYPQLQQDGRILQQVLKQLTYVLKNSRKLFNITQRQPQGKQDRILKVRVICGIFLQIFMNHHETLSGQSKKNKKMDEDLFKKLFISHCQQKTQNQQRIFQQVELNAIMQFFKQNYFDHFIVLHRFRKFATRGDTRSFSIYLETPNVEYNNKQTPWMDLTSRQQPQKVDIQPSSHEMGQEPN